MAEDIFEQNLRAMRSQRVAPAGSPAPAPTPEMSSPTGRADPGLRAPYDPFEANLAAMQSSTRSPAAAAPPRQLPPAGEVDTTGMTPEQIARVQALPEITGSYIDRAMTKGVVGGALGLPALAGDIAYNAAMLGPAAYDYIRGKPQQQRFGMPLSSGVSRLGDAAADNARQEYPQTNKERLISAGVEGAAGAAGSLVGGGAVRRAGEALSEVPAIGRFLSWMGRGMQAAPGNQAIAGAAANTTSEYLTQTGSDPVTSAVAGLLAGGGVGAVVPAARTVREVVRPFSQAGQEHLVGRTLNGMASQPERSQMLAANPRQLVPGSEMTLGQATGDVGLLNLERGVQRTPQGQVVLGERAIAQNQARVNALDGISGTEADIARMRQGRTNFADRATTSILDSPPRVGPPEVAPNVPASPMGLGPVLEEVQRIRQSRAGVNSAVASALDEVEHQLTLARDPGTLYAVRDNIQSMLQPPKFGAGQAYTPRNIPVDLSRARRFITPIINRIDDAIEATSPGYRAYMEEMARRAQPINQMEVLQEIRNRAISPGSTMPGTTTPALNLGSLNRAIASKSDEIASILTPEQRTVLQRVVADLNRSEWVNNRAVRAPGSDTLQNISVANVLGRVLGNPDSALARTVVGRPFAWILRVPEQDVTNLLVQAVANPQLAARLMGSASRRNIMDASSELARLAAGMQSSAVQAAQGPEDRNAVR